MYKVGDTYTTTVEYTLQIHDIYKNVFGDDSKPHREPVPPFKEPIGYAAALHGFLSYVYTHLPKETTICTHQVMEHHRSFTVGDVIRIEAKITKKHENLKLLIIKTEFYVGDRYIAQGEGCVQLLENTSG